MAVANGLMAGLRPYAAEIDNEVLEACQGADVVVSGFLAEGRAAVVAEHLEVPLVLVHTVPARRTDAIPFPPVRGTELPRYQLPGLGGRRTGLLAHGEAGDKPAEATSRPGNDAQANGPAKRRPGRAELQAYSPALVPGLERWPSRRPVIGALELGAEERRRLGEGPLPADLDAWLADGEPPAYFGFGSMSLPDPQRALDMVGRVSTSLGMRAVVSGPGGFASAHASSRDLRVVGAVNHPELLAQVPPGRAPRRGRNDSRGRPCRDPFCGLFVHDGPAVLGQPGPPPWCRHSRRVPQARRQDAAWPPEPSCLLPVLRTERAGSAMWSARNRRPSRELPTSSRRRAQATQLADPWAVPGSSANCGWAPTGRGTPNGRPRSVPPVGADRAVRERRRRLLSPPLVVGLTILPWRGRRPCPCGRYRGPSRSARSWSCSGQGLRSPAATPTFNVDALPAAAQDYVPYLEQGGLVCDDVDAALLAAQVQVSDPGWDPDLTTTYNTSTPTRSAGRARRRRRPRSLRQPRPCRRRLPRRHEPGTGATTTTNPDDDHSYGDGQGHLRRTSPENSKLVGR